MSRLRREPLPRLLGIAPPRTHDACPSQSVDDAPTPALRRVSSAGTGSAVRGLGAAAGVVLGMAVAWWAPQSPIALWRADDRLAAGDVVGAVALYEAVADHALIASTRRAAMERAAAVWWSDRDAPERAAHWLRALAAEAPDSASRAVALERLAAVVPLDEALAALDAAAAADAGRACDLLSQAAERAAQAVPGGPGDALDRARTRWNVVRDRCTKNEAAAAWLAEGDALLGAGHLDEAQDAYERVAGDVVLRQAAAAGIGVCRLRRGAEGGEAVADAAARR